MKINPLKGTAFNTDFIIQFRDWVDLDSPLTYRILLAQNITNDDGNV